MANEEKIVIDAVITLKLVGCGKSKYSWRAECITNGERIYFVEQDSLTTRRGHLQNLVDLVSISEPCISDKETKSSSNARRKFREFLRSIKQAWVEFIGE